jgi:hypothetical protein
MPPDPDAQPTSPAPPDIAAPGLPGEARGDSEAIPAAYARAFSLVAFTMNRFIVDHVVRASRLFDNDIEAMILFGTVAHLNAAHLMPPGASPARVLGADGRVPDAQPQMRPVRIRDLTQISGRPRETVRRQLARLVDQGRLLRGIDGYVINVAAVDPQMHALTLDAVRRFMAAARLVEKTLHDAEQALASERSQGAS